MLLSRAFAAVVVSGALLSGVAALAPAASAATTSTTKVSVTALKVTAPKVTAPAGHLRGVSPTATTNTNSTDRGHLRALPLGHLR